MKHLPNILVFIALLSTYNCSFAQTNDFELWSNAKITKELSDRFDISFSEEVRLNENATTFDKIFTDVGASYKLNYKFEIGAYYRFINARKINATYSKEHRYYFDIKYTERITRLKISYRARFQSKYSNMYSDYAGLIPSNYLRNKISAEFDLKDTKFNPTASTEMYYRLNGKKKNMFNKLRFKIGSEYELSKESTIEVYYMLQHEFNVKNPVNSYIIGISYSYKF